jgi:tagatose-1,6-bisphosphate aldolase non-catalytic subunit AgaZ/GatZ
MHAMQALEATSVDAVAYTLDVPKRILVEQGLGKVWQRVVALVVQTGVKFD